MKKPMVFPRYHFGRGLNLHPLRGFIQAIAGLVIISSPLTAKANWQISGGITSAYQITSDDRIDPEVLASADLVIRKMFKKGDLRLYIEGNSTPGSNRVSSLLPEVNADAGSALDKDRKGRVQISELAYHHVFGNRHELTFGLIDVTGYFDQSRIAGDENTQFLGVSFVQNPTIDFPDYTLGAVYEHFADHNLTFRLGLTGSNGLADNSNLSYSQLLDVDNTDKGVFAIVSAAMTNPEWNIRIGTWIHTAPHTSLDGKEDNINNYGAFAVCGYGAAFGSVNLRFGLANEAVSRAVGFTAVTYQYSISPVTFGIGWGRAFLSSREPDTAADDLSQFETYLRWDIAEKFIASADIQRLANSNFDTSDAIVDSDVVVYGLRLTFLWD